MPAARERRTAHSAMVQGDRITWTYVQTLNGNGDVMFGYGKDFRRDGRPISDSDGEHLLRSAGIPFSH